MLRNRDYKLRSFLIQNDNYGVFTTFYKTINNITLVKIVHRRIKIEKGLGLGQG